MAPKPAELHAVWKDCLLQTVWERPSLALKAGSQADGKLLFAELTRIQLSSINTAIRRKKWMKFWYPWRQLQRNRKLFLSSSHPCHCSKARSQTHPICANGFQMAHLFKSPFLLCWISLLDKEPHFPLIVVLQLTDPLQTQCSSLLPSPACNEVCSTLINY